MDVANESRADGLAARILKECSRDIKKCCRPECSDISAKEAPLLAKGAAWIALSEHPEIDDSALFITARNEFLKWIRFEYDHARFDLWFRKSSAEMINERVLPWGSTISQRMTEIISIEERDELIRLIGNIVYKWGPHIGLWVVLYLSQGKSIREIGEELEIPNLDSADTRHIYRIISKVMSQERK